MPYKLVKVIIDAPKLAKEIINIVVQHHGLLDSIISDCRAIFISKFWFLLYYFFEIKKQLFTAFYYPTNRKIEWQNNIIEAYRYVFVNYKQNNWVCFLLMAEFAYNNIKNASIGHTLFKLNYGYHPEVFFKDECNALFRSSSTKRLAIKLKELINICCQNLLHA